MKIIVLVKEVPDTYGDRKLNLETGLADRDASDRVLDEVGERALEAALQFKDKNPGTEVTVICAGPESVSKSLRKALAMGADAALHICDAALAGADLGLTAEVLAVAAKKTGFDLILTGNLSTDGAAGLIPAMVAERLGAPHATFLSTWSLTADGVVGTRATDGGVVSLKAPLPAVVSVTEAFPDPRMPSFKGIMAAKKKPLQTWTLSDLDVSAEPVAPRSIMTAIAEKPSRAAGIRVVDDGKAGTQLAQFLLENRLV